MKVQFKITVRDKAGLVLCTITGSDGLLGIIEELINQSAIFQVDVSCDSDK